MQFGRGTGVLLEQHARDAHRDHGHRRPDPVAQRAAIRGRPADRAGSRTAVDTSRVTSGLCMVVLGLGMGFLMQMTTLIAQNSVEPRDIGVASSSRLFFQQIGGSIGVSAFGAIFARRLTDALTSVSPGVHLSTSGGQFNPATVRGLPAAIQHDVYYAISYAIHGVFLWAIPASALAFVLAWFTRKCRSAAAPPPATPRPPSPNWSPDPSPTSTWWVLRRIRRKTHHVGGSGVSRRCRGRPPGSPPWPPGRSAAGRWPCRRSSCR